jgi:hypothetical protein
MVWTYLGAGLRYFGRSLKTAWRAVLENTNAVNAFGTLIVGVATTALVASTIMQWRAFVTSDERSRRAWLSPINFEIKGILGASDNPNYVQLGIEYQNTGREPAVNVAFYGAAKLFDAASARRLGDSLNTLTIADIPLLDENNSCNDLLPLVAERLLIPPRRHAIK